MNYTYEPKKLNKLVKMLYEIKNAFTDLINNITGKTAEVSERQQKFHQEFLASEQNRTLQKEEVEYNKNYETKENIYEEIDDAITRNQKSSNYNDAASELSYDPELIYENLPKYSLPDLNMEEEEDLYMKPVDIIQKPEKKVPPLPPLRTDSLPAIDNTQKPEKKIPPPPPLRTDSLPAIDNTQKSEKKEEGLNINVSEKTKNLPKTDLKDVKAPPQQIAEQNINKGMER
ncbi:hypothetical protein GUI12_02825 [Anaplasmataceae bacterium AB001_6]|nr:hypothetical protein GUI12_02825 [Anaplasmataceae bacterium AB001_6]